MNLLRASGSVSRMVLPKGAWRVVNKSTGSLAAQYEVAMIDVSWQQYLIHRGSNLACYTQLEAFSVKKVSTDPSDP